MSTASSPATEPTSAAPQQRTLTKGEQQLRGLLSILESNFDNIDAIVVGVCAKPGKHLIVQEADGSPARCTSTCFAVEPRHVPERDDGQPAMACTPGCTGMLYELQQGMRRSNEHSMSPNRRQVHIHGEGPMPQELKDLLGRLSQAGDD